MFDEKEVVKIAKAIINRYTDFDNNSYDHCTHCEHIIYSRGFGVSREDHELDCPVILAKDMLTGYEGEL